MTSQTTYEVREQSNERPEDSRLLRVCATRDEAMQLAQQYNERGVNAFVRKIAGE